MKRWTSNHAYRLGGEFDGRARASLTESRLGWILHGLLAHSLFEVLAPFTALAHRDYLQVLESVAFAFLVICVAFLVAPKRIEPPRPGRSSCISARASAWCEPTARKS